ncbi:uncharacterized mitochondrial protein AtMg00810-like [Miscanthus floridulus]|uniref:uncharacterized mitochondrial protein AtMg00810-like n=1 Tax=Miscanthus floridulus TaxID=154761 RepID=UPI003459FD04
MGVAKDWFVHYLDVKSTFLNDELMETVFVKQAPGFTIKGAEHMVLKLRKGKEELIVGMYVDDLIITRARAEDIDDFKREMVAHFKMSDLGMLFYYLNIEVRQGKQSISLGQCAYTEKLLEHDGMAVCKPCVTPMEERLKLSKHSTTAKVDMMHY